MKTFGPYTLLRLLGSGANGQVYEAVRKNSSTHVALKRLFPNVLEDEAAVSRFVREFRAACRVQHAHVMKVFDAGRVEGAPYYTMELLSGETLRKYVTRDVASRRPARTLFKVLSQVAQALSALHSLGVTHRDVKPENIMLRGADDAVLSDFGLARARDDRVVTKPGHIVGTLRYAAPEVIQGDPADARADAYAFGVTAFEVLSGEAPFPGDEAQVMIAHVENEPPSVLERLPAAPETLVRLIGALLAKDAGARPSMARAAAVLAHLSGEGVTLRKKESRKQPARSVQSVFVGRQEELVRLDDALAKVPKASPRMALISGGKGLGKSRLAAEFEKHCVRAGGAVASGRAGEGVNVPYQMWRQPLEHLARKLKVPAPDFDARQGGHGAEHRTRLWREVRGLLHEACGLTTVAIFLDDVDKGDELSLHLITRCQGKDMAGHKLLLVMTAENPQLILRALDDSTRCTHVALQPLNEKQSKALYRQVLPDDGEDDPAPPSGNTGGIPADVVDAAIHAATLTGDGDDDDGAFAPLGSDAPTEEPAAAFPPPVPADAGDDESTVELASPVVAAALEEQKPVRPASSPRALPPPAPSQRVPPPLPPEMPPMAPPALSRPPPLPVATGQATVPPPLPARPPPLPRAPRPTVLVGATEASPVEALEWTLAVLEGRAPMFMVLRLLDFPEDSTPALQVTDALQRLMTNQMVQEDSTGCLDFVTAPRRAQAYQGMPAEARAWLHKRVADTISSSGASAAASAEVVAYHLLRAGQMELAVDHLIHAAEAAVVVWAPEKAVALVVRGLEALSGKPGRDARELMERAARTSVARAVRLNLIRLHVLRMQGQSNAYLQESLLTRSVLVGSLYRQLASDVEGNCAEAALLCGHLAEADDHARQALELAQQADDPVRVADCALLRYRVRAAGGDGNLRGALAEAIVLSRRTQDGARRVPPLIEDALLHLAQGRPHLALRPARRAVALANPRTQRRENLHARRVLAGAWLDLDNRAAAGPALLDHVADAEVGGFLQESAEGLLELARFHRNSLEFQFVDSAAIKALALARELGFRPLYAPACGIRLSSACLAGVRQRSLQRVVTQDLPDLAAALRAVVTTETDAWWQLELSFHEALADVLKGSTLAVAQVQADLAQVIPHHPRRWFEHRALRLILADACRAGGLKDECRTLARELAAEDGPVQQELQRLVVGLLSATA